MPNLIDRLLCRQSDSSLLELEFDELPQSHMTEFQKASDSYEILEMSNEDPLAGTASTSRARMDIEDHWTASATMLSPLERFYYKYIAQYDLREDVPLSKRGKSRAEKKCKRKLSADNTISSLDSLTCDENHKHKVASTKSDLFVKNLSKDGLVGNTNTAIREQHCEEKVLLRKDWESSDQTSRSEPVLSYMRHDGTSYEQMDPTFDINPAPEDEADLAKKDYDTSSMFQDNVANEDSVSDYEQEPDSNKPGTRSRDDALKFCLDKGISEMIISVSVKLLSSPKSPNKNKNKASSSKDPSLLYEVHRSPMRIRGKNVYINIGGENTQIKSYKDYGTVKISERKSKKLSKKTKASMKPTFGHADVSRKKAKSRSRQFRDTADVAKNSIDVAEMCSMQGRSRVDGPAFQVSTEGCAVDNASMEAFMSETLEAMTMAQICSAFRDDEPFVDSVARESSPGCPSGHAVPAPETSVDIAFGDQMETLNNSAGHLEVAEEESSSRRTELPHDDPLRNEAVSSRSDCPPGVSNISNGNPSHAKKEKQPSREEQVLISICACIMGDQDFQEAQILPGAEDPTGAQTKVARDLPAAIIQPVEEEEKVSDETGMVDIYSLRKGINGQNRQLKKYMTKFREKTENIGRLHKYMEQLQLETAEMKRLLAGVDRETEALRCEAAEMRCTVTAICDLSVATIGKDTEARRLEPACYRRYLNIRTAADALAALNAVRNRIKALSDLEVLIYRKQLVLHHVLPTLTQDKAPPPKRANRPAHKGHKSKKAHESASSQTTSGGGHIVIDVVSPAAEITTPSWSGEVSNTESPMTNSAPLSGSNDGTVSTVLPDTEV